MRTLSLCARDPGAQTLRTPLLTTLSLLCMVWMPLGSSAAQQVRNKQIAFEALPDSQWVRLKLSNTAGRYEGRLLRRGRDQWVLSAEATKAARAGWPEPLLVAPTTIDTLWVARPATGSGAAIGALVGVVAGTIAGLAVCADCQDTPPEAVTVGGAAAGALLGALVGAGIGAVSRRWVRRYPI